MQCDGNKALEIILGRLNDCLWDINDELPIDIYDEIRNLKLDLIMWAMDETNKNVTRAAKILNMNRVTMTSMVHNELAPLIRKRAKLKAAQAASVSSQEQSKAEPQSP